MLKLLTRLALSGMLLGLAVGCGKPGPAIILSVAPLPENAELLQIMVVLGDTNPQVSQDVPEFSLANAAGKQTFTVGIRLPDGADGVAQFAVAAVDKTNDCLIATGLSKPTRINATSNVELAATAEVTLELLATPDCGQGLKQPRLFGFSPRTLPPASGADTLWVNGTEIFIQGWGFRPEMQLSVGGQPVTMQKWISPLEMSGKIPNLRGTLGRVDVAIANPVDGNTDLLPAFLKYLHQPSFSMATYPLPNTQNFRFPGSTRNTITDLDGVNGPDLVVYNYENPLSYYAINVNIRNSDGTYKGWQAFTMPQFLDAVLPADYAGNGKLAIGLLDADIGGSKFYMMNHQGGVFSAPALTHTFTFGPGASASRAYSGRFNGDTKADLLLLYTPDGSAYELDLAIGDGTGKFSAPVKVITMAPNTLPQTLLTTDLNGDNYSDIILNAIGGASPQGVDVYINNKSNGFSKTHFNNLFATIALFDINGDMKPDIVAREGVLLNQGGGVFAASTIYGFSDTPLLGGNLNGDGVLDLVSANSISLGLSAQPPSWRLQPAMNAIDQPVRFGVDLNGDNYLDVVTLNHSIATVLTNTSGNP